MSSLPEEILIEIFSRLPAKSAGKCRCLSKSWQTRLSQPQFIQLHLNHRKTHPQNLFLLAQHLHILTPPFTDDAVSSKFGFEEYLSWRRVLGSCNGLVLLEHTCFGMKLINPITQENVDIHWACSEVRQHDGKELHRLWGLEKLCGFGYDSSTDDYKIVLFFYYHDLINPNDLNLYGFVDVFSVKLGVWRSINTCVCTHDNGVVFSYGAFVNGSVHWLSGDREAGYPSKIVAFRLSDEVMFELPTPPNVYDDKFRFNSLSVLGGCLCMINRGASFYIDVWMMKQYGSVASWTSFSFDTRYKWDIDIPLCLNGDKEIVFITEDEVVAMYHLGKKTTKEMAVDGRLIDFVGGSSFVDSLVSLKQHEI